MSNTEEFDVNDRLTLPAILEDPQSHFCVCPSHTPLIDSKHTESYFLAIENSLPQPRFISSTNEVHTSKGIPTRSVRHFVQSSSNNVKAPILNNHSSSSQQYCLSCQPLRTTAVQGGNIQPFNLSNMIQLEIVDGKPKVIRQSESSVPTKPPRSFESLLTHSTADDINNSSNAALSVPINNKRKNLTQGTNRPPPPYISENDKKDIDSLVPISRVDDCHSSLDSYSSTSNFMRLVLCIIGCLVVLFFTLILIFIAIRYSDYHI